MSGAKLEHALVYVTDLDRTLAFYRQLLPEWTVRWEGTSSHGYRWIHFGAVGNGQPGYLSLCERKGLPLSEADGLQIAHLGFAHPDVNALDAKLTAAGVKTRDHTDDGLYRRFYLSDPDGHELEVVQKLS